jgi:hypothetical protein
MRGQQYAPAALYPLPGKTRYPLYRRLGEPQGRSGQVRKTSPPPTGIRSPDRPACSQSLYRLSYQAHFFRRLCRKLQFFITSVPFSEMSIKLWELKTNMKIPFFGVLKDIWNGISLKFHRIRPLVLMIGAVLSWKCACSIGGIILTGDKVQYYEETCHGIAVSHKYYIDRARLPLVWRLNFICFLYKY